MIIDSHYHYMASEFDIEKKIKAMDAAGISKIALMPPVCPVFKTDPKSLPLRGARLLMGRRLLYPFFKMAMCTFEGDGIDILGKHYPLFFLPGNKPVFDAVAKAPDRFCAYVLVNPDRQTEEEMCAEVDKYKNEDAFCGIKVHPYLAGA